MNAHFSSKGLNFSNFLCHLLQNVAIQVSYPQKNDVNDELHLAVATKVLQHSANKTEGNWFNRWILKR